MRNSLNKIAGSLNIFGESAIFVYLCKRKKE